MLLPLPLLGAPLSSDFWLPSSAACAGRSSSAQYGQGTCDKTAELSAPRTTAERKATGDLCFVFMKHIQRQGPRAAAASATAPPGAERPAGMGQAVHSVGPKAVVRIEVAVSPRPCLGCAVELALRIAPLRRGVPPR
jgi:hypothetical protein